MKMQLQFLRFPIDVLLTHSKKLILEPNLKPGETGIINFCFLDFFRIHNL